jgi:predicted dehydrogenase
MIGIGVIGYGYWGPNLVRNFTDAPGSRVVTVSDLRPERVRAAQQRYPALNAVRDHREVLDDPMVDAVAIATPVSTHFDLAMDALRAGKHVLVEKPLTATSEQAARLIDEANRRRLVLMVDHTFIYTGAVRKLRELVEQQRLGQLYYYDSVRVNLGLFQHDLNVLWDLAVHDLAIMDYVLGTMPLAITATGVAHVPGQPEDIAYVTCFFDGQLIGHLHVNWLAPVKMRRTLIGGAQQMIVYDDLEPSEKVKVYDRGITVNDSPEGVYQMLVGYRTGDVWAPQVSLAEALQVEALHFLDCVQHARPPISGGEAGLRVVRTLEAAAASLAQRARVIELSAS